MTIWGTFDLMSLSRDLAPFVLVLLAAIFGLSILVLWYHWWRFALRPERGALWLFIYVVGGLGLLGTMIGAAIAL